MFPIANQTVSMNNSATQIDLAGYFTDPDMTDSEVTFNITNGGDPESLNVTSVRHDRAANRRQLPRLRQGGRLQQRHLQPAGLGLRAAGRRPALNSAGNGLNVVPLNPGGAERIRGIEHRRYAGDGPVERQCQ